MFLLGVTVDFITGNIYWTDSGLDRIGVASSDGSYQAVLVSNGLRNPRGIAVDPFGGYACLRIDYILKLGIYVVLVCSTKSIAVCCFLFKTFLLFACS